MERSPDAVHDGTPAYSSSQRMAEYLAHTLPLTRLGDIVAKCDIFRDEDVTTTVVDDDQWIVEVERALRIDATSTDCDSSYVVRLELLQDVMRVKELTPPMVCRMLRGRLSGRAVVTASEVNSVDWVIRIRFREVAEMMRLGGLANEQEAILCHRAVNVLLDTVVVMGHPQLTGASVGEVTDRTGRVEYVVHAYGNC